MAQKLPANEGNFEQGIGVNTGLDMGGIYHDICNRINLEEQSTVKISRLASWGYPTWPY